MKKTINFIIIAVTSIVFLFVGNNNSQVSNNLYCGEDVIIIPPVRMPDTSTQQTKKSTKKLYCGQDVIIIPPVRSPDIETQSKKKKLVDFNSINIENTVSNYIG